MAFDSFDTHEPSKFRWQLYACEGRCPQQSPYIMDDHSEEDNITMVGVVQPALTALQHHSLAVSCSMPAHLNALPSSSLCAWLWPVSQRMSHDAACLRGGTVLSCAMVLESPPTVDAQHARMRLAHGLKRVCSMRCFMHTLPLP